MSSRVTRSSVKNSPDRSILSQDILEAHPLSIPLSSSKRKESEVESTTSATVQDSTAEPPSKRVRRSGRSKSIREQESNRGGTELPAPAQSHRSRRKSRSVMSGAAPPDDRSVKDSSPLSDPVTSSRRTSGKSKQTTIGSSPLKLRISTRSC